MGHFARDRPRHGGGGSIALHGDPYARPAGPAGDSAGPSGATGDSRGIEWAQLGQPEAEPAAGDSSPRDALWRLANAYQASQAIQAAATLGIADMLADGPKTVDQLAEATATSTP